MKNKIKKIIDKKGLKTIFVIKQTGISKTHFYDIMNGNANPSITNAYKIAQALDEPLEEVFPCNFDKQQIIQ